MLLLILALFYSANGQVDGLYLKFTTPEKSSLILGTSKAAQGLRPSIINNVLGRDDLYNYAFTLAHSSFGPAYLESINKKLDKSTKNGIFIITVDPYSVSGERGNANDINSFKENEYAVGKIKNVNSFPNFEYLLFHYQPQYFYLLAPNIKSAGEGLEHDDGWVQTGLPTDDKSVKRRTMKNVLQYKKQVDTREFSEVRFNYLIKTIELLNRHGQVYIVRLPILKPLLKLENSVVPNFDSKIQDLCDKYDLNYLNLTSGPDIYSYLDGNHLDENSSSVVSKQIANWIKTLN
tara:strand:- start:188 stop:1060 length:873 start_codon:yes stop_codon:yes gene_type:complete